MTTLVVVLVVVFVVGTMPPATALRYLFTASEYSLEEGTANAMVVTLQRTPEILGNTSETSVESSITLSTECPFECPAMSGGGAALPGTQASGGDYTVNTPTVTFAPNDLQETISITIHDDEDEELREYFCLTVTDPNIRGSQWYTKVIIPWNDHCVKHRTYIYPDGGKADADAESWGYFITLPITTTSGYIGPWSTDDAETITIKVLPQLTTEENTETETDVTGDGGDINIYLATSADPTTYKSGSSFNYYGIHLDDTTGSDASKIATADDASYIVKDGPTQGASATTGTLVGTEETTDELVVDDELNIYELSYNAGTITLKRTSPSAETLSGTDYTDPYDIKHLFVSTAGEKYAAWEICGLEPKRLPRVAAYASGSRSNYDPGRVIDDIVDELSCWISDADEEGNHWLQIDLGREFEVKQVVVLPVFDNIKEYANTDSLNNARIYVGSCRIDDVLNNHECSESIGDVSDSSMSDHETLIDVTCAGSNVYGRYVYVLPDLASTINHIGVCDIWVFGNEVPIDKETKVEFSTVSTSVEENGSTGDVTLSLTRTGDGRTCTYVDYYTSVPFGNDFTAVPAGFAKEIKITGTADTQSDQITIEITNDDVCEPTETFNVYLTDIEGGLLGSQCWTTVEIDDDDAVSYELVNSIADTISEGIGQLGIEVERTGSVTQDGKATLTFTDVEATSKDYDNSLKTLSYSSTDSNTHGVFVNIDDDECYEESETFLVNLDDLKPVCSATDGTSPLSVTITDNDSKFEWDVSTNTIIVAEGSGSLTIDITREGTEQDKTVEFDVDYGTAEIEDFSIRPYSSSVTFPATSNIESITIAIADDHEVEENELFTLTLRDPNGEDCPHGNLGKIDHLKIEIEDNDAEYSLEQPTYSIDESGGQVEVCLVRTGDTTSTKTVAMSTTKIAAQPGSDFEPLTEVTFRGTRRQCVQVQIFDDDSVEGQETFAVAIVEGQDIAIGTPIVATVTINDDDSDVSWAQSSYEISEGAGSTSFVTITKSGNNPVTLSVTSSPVSATSGSDFELVSLTVQIPATTNSYPIELQILDDPNGERSESFTLTLRLSPGSSGTISQAITTITIIDDDLAPTEPPSSEGLSAAAKISIAVGVIVGVITIVIAIIVVIYLINQSNTGRASVGATDKAARGLTGGARLANLGEGGNAFGIPNYRLGNELGFINESGNNPFTNEALFIGYP